MFYKIILAISPFLLFGCVNKYVENYNINFLSSNLITEFYSSGDPKVIKLQQYENFYNYVKIIEDKGYKEIGKSRFHHCGKYFNSSDDLIFAGKNVGAEYILLQVVFVGSYTEIHSYNYSIPTSNQISGYINGYYYSGNVISNQQYTNKYPIHYECYNHIASFFSKIISGINSSEIIEMKKPNSKINKKNKSLKKHKFTRKARSQLNFKH